MEHERASPAFTSGLELSRHFFEDAVRPILATRFPGLRYAAALIGPGSEVLGFDTPISTDHHWGPRVMLFLSEQDHREHRAAIEERLRHELPHSFLGYPTNFGPPDEIGVRLLQSIDSGPVAHRVEVLTVAGWFSHYLGWNTTSAPTTREWLTFPQHRLRAATTGEVFCDDLGELALARASLAWYPPDLWLYHLASQWNRIAEEEAFMARCGDVGDELGSALVAARLVRDIMRLSFLMERQYIPYAKWFGSAFRRLPIGSELEPALLGTIHSETWQLRQRALSIALERIAEWHNALKITEPLEPRVRPYYDRPYLVIGAGRFVSAIESSIGDAEVRELPRWIGSLNQVVDSTDMLEDPNHRARLARIFD